jgi:hypothetical protein
MKAHALTLSNALASKQLFGPHFAGDSWNRWRAVLKAAFAEPLSADELTSFREVAGRAPPKTRVKELDCIIGRNGGKDSAASLIASYVACTFSPKGRLRPGERATVATIACDRVQAQIAFNYIRGLFEQVPTLRAMVTRITGNTVELSNSVTIEVHTNSFRSVRGRSMLCCIMDECAFYRADDVFASPDFELHAAVAPSLARVVGSMLVLISTAHKKSGLLYEHWKSHFGKDDDDVLCVKGTTVQFNPLFDQRVIAKALIDDPQLYGAEYNSEWRSDLAAFISRDLIEAAVDRGVTVRPPQAGIQYKSFCDPSGGAGGGDSFTAAVAHAEGDNAVLDCLIEFKSPLNPDTVTSHICATLKEYRISSTVSDRYAAQWVVAAFARNDIKLEHSKRDRSEIYCDCLPLFTSGRARLLDNSRLVSQFAQLERRTFSNGKDRIDHGRHGHDDCCNSAAGAMVLAAEKSGFDSSYDWVGGPGPNEQPSIYSHPDIRGSFAGQWWIR